MLYRKAPPSPPRLLLRIVTTAGAGALLGVAACSSSSNSGGSGIMGVVTNPSDSGGDDLGSEASTIMTGVMPSYPDARACGGGPCGSMIMPPGDAGETGDASIASDASDASDLAADAPSDAAIVETDAIAHCGGVCGIVVGVVVQPDH
jgi:hypothetical protein